MLGITYGELGDYRNAESELREALRVGADVPLPYANLGMTLLAANKFSELHKLLGDAKSKGLDDNSPVHELRFEVALVTSDAAALADEQVWSQQTSDQMAAAIMQLEGEVESGRRSDAQSSTNWAIKIAARANMRDAAAYALLYEAWAEALWGETTEPIHTAQIANDSCKSTQCRSFGARIFAMAGATDKSRQLSAGLTKSRPKDVLLNSVSVPLVQSLLAYKAGQGELALRAQDALRPFDFGSIAGVTAAYIRGLAFEQLHKPQDAIKEFQSILDHEGLGSVAPERVLAYLQLGRCYVASRNVEKGRAAYQHFLTLWKEADPDIPILKQAKAEYAKLQ